MSLTHSYYTGNAVPAPGYQTNPTNTDEELLYSTKAYIQKGVTLKPGQGVLYAGTLLKQDTASKQYVRATDNTATGVLRKTTDTGTDSSASAQVWLANILYGGVLKLSLVSSANSGVTDLTTVLGATVNTVAGFFKF